MLGQKDIFEALHRHCLYVFLDTKNRCDHNRNDSEGLICSFENCPLIKQAQANLDTRFQPNNKWSEKDDFIS